jgi:membrane-associated protein
MEFFHKLYDLLRHLGDDTKWQDMINYIGIGTLYAVLFGIVFCETGLVIMPFLPGDSLLFAIGAMVARNVGINLPVISGLLVLAALCGDNVNYWIGRRIGPKVFSREKSRFFNVEHLHRAHKFYEKYGKKTIIMARFVPIVRTFAPFVAGIGEMPYPTFLLFSVIGAVLWVNVCLTAGYLLGGLDFFKKHFELVILIIVVISLIPMVIEFLKARAEKKKQGFEVVK